MKRFVISILVLILMAVGIMLSLDYIGKTKDELASIVDTAMDAARLENYEKTKEQIVYLEKRWNDTQSIFTLFVRHDHIDLVSDALAEMSVYIENRDFDEVQVSLNTLGYRLDEVWRSELPTFTNVF